MLCSGLYMYLHVYCRSTQFFQLSLVMESKKLIMFKYNDLGSNTILVQFPFPPCSSRQCLVHPSQKDTSSVHVIHPAASHCARLNYFPQIQSNDCFIADQSTVNKKILKLQSDGICNES